MAFFFGRSKQKSPAELVRLVRESIGKLEFQLEKRKAQEDISKNIALMKNFLLGDSYNDADPDHVAQLAQEIYTSDLLLLLGMNLWRLDFDAKKDYTSLFTMLLRRQIGTRYPTIDYLQTHDQV